MAVAYSLSFFYPSLFLNFCVFCNLPVPPVCSLFSFALYFVCCGLIKHCRGPSFLNKISQSFRVCVGFKQWCCEAQPEISAWLDSSWSAQPEISSCGSPSIRSYYQNLLLFVRCLEFDFSSVPSGACTRSACTVSSGAVSLCLICLILCSFRFFLVVISRSLVFARACC
jgi:hypothetical protein